MTKRGGRGKRFGEADTPGPVRRTHGSCHFGLVFQSLWALGAHVLCLQDAKLSRRSPFLPSFRIRPVFVDSRALRSFGHGGLQDLSSRPHGSSQAPAGLRAVRIGEASNPGPDRNVSDPHENRLLKLMTYNISSAQRHFHATLDEADKAQAQLHGVSRLTDVAHACRQKGWSCVAVKALRGISGKAPSGGVAILAKEPLALTQIYSVGDLWGQIFVAEVLGTPSPF